MSVDADILAEAIAVLRAVPSFGRCRALRGILAAYPAARLLVRSTQ